MSLKSSRSKRFRTTKGLRDEVEVLLLSEFKFVLLCKGGPPLAKRASNISDITLPASIMKLFVFVPIFILPIDSDNMTVASSSGAGICSSVSVLVGKACLPLELFKALLDLRLGKVPPILPIFRAGSLVVVGTAVVAGAGDVNGACITGCGAAKLVAVACGALKPVKPAEARRLHWLLRFAASVTRATQSARYWAYVLRRSARRSACVLVSGGASRISLISSRSFNPACNIRCEAGVISSSLNRGARIAANGFGGGPGAGELSSMSLSFCNSGKCSSEFDSLSSLPSLSCSGIKPTSFTSGSSTNATWRGAWLLDCGTGLGQRVESLAVLYKEALQWEFDDFHPQAVAKAIARDFGDLPAQLRNRPQNTFRHVAAASFAQGALLITGTQRKNKMEYRMESTDIPNGR
uniref:Uncharacterized protein n=1 Tax=Glossina pallidipes TaxID=7398 RepID=A0A1B0AFN3_GLOPL